MKARQIQIRIYSPNTSTRSYRSVAPREEIITLAWQYIAQVLSIVRNRVAKLGAVWTPLNPFLRFVSTAAVGMCSRYVIDLNRTSTQSTPAQILGCKSNSAHHSYEPTI